MSYVLPKYILYEVPTYVTVFDCIHRAKVMSLFVQKEYVQFAKVDRVIE